ncbi:alpha/beta fold hydrolase [Corallococcus llansteffanensis]|uniref:Alpha/beta fold hydrolase n=1 Tax=Corallococcus llansteffanensis TaxID=2316731 RepID=A0A3A8PTR6_9BACT|nr:alpha/beta hydrolase [Corallococcus llansteffanensis]RKH59847.1 alpha/beta fold hydrolase [Corallococcus llansteffanensis]
MRMSWFSSAVLLLSACATTPSVPPGGDVDPLHQVRRVQVAQDVELEVLDYGGTGPALVFLPGMGSTAHIFDVLAPEFLGTHHVYAFTRRGYGASSWPASGYDSATLGHDVLVALDGLGLAKATLAGHSLAGDEMTWLGAHHPERVEALIFLDATDDRGEIAVFLKDGPLPPLPFSMLDGQPSREAVAAIIERDLGGRFPPHEIEQAYEFDATTGAWLRHHRHPDAVELSVRGVALPDFAKLRGPVLAISDEQAFTDWVAALSTSEGVSAQMRERARLFLPEIREHEAAKTALLKGLPNWKLVTLQGAGHYLWLTRHAEVVAEMRAFLAR